MKAILILILLMSEAAFAQSFMFSRPKESNGLAAPPPPPQRKPLINEPVAKGQPAPKTPAPTETVPNGCTSEFKKAAKMFQAIHGADIDLSKIPPFPGTISGLGSVNTLKSSGGALIINMNIAGGIVNTDIPVSVCKVGNKMTAKLITSKARTSDTNQLEPIIAGKVQAKEIPQTIVLAVDRRGNNLVFSGQANDTPFTTSASIK